MKNTKPGPRRAPWVSANLFRSLGRFKSLGQFGLLGFICFSAVSNLNAQQKKLDIKTVAEQSDFKATSRTFEVSDFIKKCAEKANHVSVAQFGKTTLGKPMEAVICSIQPYQLGQSDNRNVAIIIGNIHSGECAGKEALLMMVRQLTNHPEHPWLKNNVLIFVPNYNSDSNDLIGRNNRPGQVGPELGMGKRETVKGFDLNRDFVKHDSSEGRSMVGLINKVNPQMFIDCHTTNGSRHRYQLTYDIPHNPAASKRILTMMRNKMMPAIASSLEKKEIYTFYYGNFNRNKTRWTTYGYEPRYSTEYVGMRGRLGILSEAYSYISYKDRIFATKAFVSQCLDYFTENGKEIRSLVDQVQKDWIQKAGKQPLQIPAKAKVAGFEKPFHIRGLDGDKPKMYEVIFYGKYSGTDPIQVPAAYVFDARFQKEARNLRRHGINVHVLTKDVEVSGQKQLLTQVRQSPRPFQKHKMYRMKADNVAQKLTLKKGSFVVLTAQPQGRLATYLLEANSTESLATWNYFGDKFEEGKAFPVDRLPKLEELPTAVWEGKKSANSK